MNSVDLLYLLKSLEWCKSYSYCTGWPCCPSCRGIKPGHGLDEKGVPPDNTGHKANCKLIAAIDYAGSPAKWERGKYSHNDLLFAIDEATTITDSGHLSISVSAFEDAMMLEDEEQPNGQG